mgnify:CR=1 FL=1
MKNNCVYIGQSFKESDGNTIAYRVVVDIRRETGYDNFERDWVFCKNFVYYLNANKTFGENKDDIQIYTSGMDLEHFLLVYDKKNVISNEQLLSEIKSIADSTCNLFSNDYIITT